VATVVPRTRQAAPAESDGAQYRGAVRWSTSLFGWFVVMCSIVCPAGCTAADDPSAVNDDLSGWYNRQVVKESIIKSSVCRGGTPFFGWSPAAQYGDYPYFGYPPPEHEPRWLCMAAATDCYEYLQCPGMREGPVACDAGEFVPRCEGKSVVSCEWLPSGEYVEWWEDCSLTAYGKTCLANSEGQPVCGHATCDSPAGCDDDVAEVCVNSVLRRVDCGKLDMSCSVVQDAAGFPAGICEMPGVEWHPIPKYSSTEPSDTECACKGSILLARAAGISFIWGEDCSLMHPDETCILLTTDTGGGPHTHCSCGFEGKYTPPLPVTCAGHTLEYCLDENCEQYDCSSFMGATCHPEPGYVCASQEWTPWTQEP